MSKFGKVISAGIRGGLVVINSIAALLIPAKFADAAAPRGDEGAHKDAVASDEGLRFELDAKADEALAQAETYVQVAQGNRTATDVVEDAIQLLDQRGVDVGALLQAGALDEAVESLVESGDVEGFDGDDDAAVDIEDVVEDLDVEDIEEIVEGS